MGLNGLTSVLLGLHFRCTLSPSLMKLAVCVKYVPSREWQPRINAAATWVREADASYELNEPDAYALETALRLRERHGGEVVVCTYGPSQVQQVLRDAMARGADRAIRVDQDGDDVHDGFATARALATALAGEPFDLILTGLQSHDLGQGVTGVALAEYLGVPHATIVLEVDVRGDHVRVKRELEGGWFQWVQLPMPALLTIQSGVHPLRYATLKGVMAAKKKDITVVPAAPAPRAKTNIVALAVPARHKATEIIPGSGAEAARELVRRLREEARVL